MDNPPYTENRHRMLVALQMIEATQTTKSYVRYAKADDTFEGVFEGPTLGALDNQVVPNGRELLPQEKRTLRELYAYDMTKFTRRPDLPGLTEVRLTAKGRRMLRTWAKKFPDIG